MSSTNNLMESSKESSVDSDDIDEGFFLMLFDGKLSMNALREAILPNGCWNEEVEEECSSSTSNMEGEKNHTGAHSNVKKDSGCSSGTIIDPSFYRTVDSNTVVVSTFHRAFSLWNYCHNNHTITTDMTTTTTKTTDTTTIVGPMKPPVQIVEFVTNNNSDRGCALIATQPIPKGSIVFTERAMECVQLLPERKKQQHTPNYTVKACQQCLRSLELVDCLNPIIRSSNPKQNQPTIQNTVEDVPKTNEETNTDPITIIPYAHLWPVPDYPWKFVNVEHHKGDTPSKATTITFNEETESYSSNNNNTNDCCYIQCYQCSSLFCSMHCYQQYLNDVGSCCLCHKALQSLYNNYPSTVIVSNDGISDDCKECTIHNTSSSSAASESSSSVESMPQLPLLLATKLFCSAIQRHRRKQQQQIQEQQQQHVIQANDDFDDDVILSQMCGNSKDLDWLEIGDEIVATPGSSCTNSIPVRRSYSLKRNYDTISTLLQLTEDEKQIYNVTYLERLVAIAARNGFEIKTESPFTAYYQAILRQSIVVGGRGTEEHKNIVSQLLKALAADNDDAKFDRRTIDADLSNLCCVSALSLFPLLSKINHSCLPNVEVQHGKFKECIVDLVAKRNIQEGEELTVSYINLGLDGTELRTTAYRRKILSARYLFWCHCPLCTSSYCSRRGI